MEHSASYILSVGLLVFIAHFFTSIFRKTKIPDVLPLIIIGMIVGPLLHIVSPEDFGHIGSLLSTIALALMLFEGGSHLSFSTLRKTFMNCVILSISTFIVTTILVALFLHHFIDIPYIFAIYTGVVLGSISPAVVVPIVKVLDISSDTRSTLVVESAITDVLSIVIALSIMKTFQNSSTSIISLLGTNLISSMIMSLIMGFIGAVIWSTVLEKIRKFPNTIFTTLAFIFILYGSSEILGYNGPMTILMFGIILANSKSIPLNIIQQFGADYLVEFTNIEKTLFSEVIFLVKTFFFVYLGISIQFQNPSLFVTGLIITILIYIARIFLVKTVVKNNDTLREKALMTFIIPKGLAAAVLVEMPMHLTIDNPELYPIFVDIRTIVYAVILFSIILTTVLIYQQENSNKTTFIQKLISKKG